MLAVQLGWTELLLITSHVGGDFFLICAIVAATYGQLNNAQGLSGKAGGLLGVTGGEFNLEISAYTKY